MKSLNRDHFRNEVSNISAVVRNFYHFKNKDKSKNRNNCLLLLFQFIDWYRNEKQLPTMFIFIYIYFSLKFFAKFASKSAAVLHFFPFVLVLFLLCLALSGFCIDFLLFVCVCRFVVVEPVRALSSQFPFTFRFPKPKY